jgi:hypothetical protein
MRPEEASAPCNKHTIFQCDYPLKNTILEFISIIPKKNMLGLNPHMTECTPRVAPMQGHIINHICKVGTSNKSDYRKYDKQYKQILT